MDVMINVLGCSSSSPVQRKTGTADVIQNLF
jgi:hypothetical protein